MRCNVLTFYKWRSFNISKTVKEWYEGTDNYGICLRADDQTAWAFAKFITSDNPSFTGGAPALQVNYRNNKGLEDYWTYHTIDLGQSGAAYIKVALISGRIVMLPSPWKMEAEDILGIIMQTDRWAITVIW